MSTQRGMGPSRQSRPVNFEALLLLDLGPEPVVKNGPLGTENLIVLFTMFLIREIEGSLALRTHVHLNAVALTVTWHLPVSKNDPAALGCQRTWGCTCITPGLPHRGCPYHAALSQACLLDERFGPQWDASDTLPFFPTETGDHAQAEAMSELVDELATRIGENTVDEEGDRILGNHSWRTGGAVYLTAGGVDPFKVNLLARWNSPMVTHYSKLAPLKAITTEFKEVIRRQRGDPTSGPASSTMRLDDSSIHKTINDQMMSKVIEQINTQAKKYEKQAKELMDMIASMDHLKPKKYVVNRKTKVTHRILAGYEEVGPGALTLCGWKYAYAKVAITSAEPTQAVSTCETCLPALRACLALQSA